MNDIQKKQRLLNLMINEATTFVDSANRFLELKSERDKLDSPITEDILVNDLQHLSIGMVGQIFDFVIPSIMANIEDVANGGRNKQNLLQVRR